MITLNVSVNSSSSNDVSQISAFHILNNVYPPILITCGLFTNILVICVMRTKYFRKQNISVYITALACNDAVSLLISMTSHWLYVSFENVYPPGVTDICKLLQLYGWGNCDFSILLSTTMSVNRAIAVSLPLKSRSKYSTRRPRIVILALLGIVLIKDFHFLFASKIVENDRLRDRLCDVYPESDIYRKFWQKVWPLLHISFLISCFLVIATANIFLIRKLYQSTDIKIRRNLSTKIQHDCDEKTRSRTKGSCLCVFGAHVDKQWQSVTPMLIGESIFLLFLTFPFSIQLATAQYRTQNSGNLDLLFSVTFYMLYTNKCATFLAYLIAGSRFRSGLKKMFFRCAHGKGAVRRRQFKETLAWINNLSENIAYGGDKHPVT